MLPSEFKRFTDESQPLVIDPEVAKKIGLNESIIIRQLHYWLKINEISDKKNNFHTYNGKIYCWNTISEWQEQFPFWSESTIKRAFEKLKMLELVNIVQNPIDKRDRTNWYTINYEKYASSFDKLALGQNDLMHEVKLTQPVGQNEPLYNYTEITSEITSEIECVTPSKLDVTSFEKGEDEKECNMDSGKGVTAEDKTNSNSSVSEIMGTPPAATQEEPSQDNTDSLFDQFWSEYPRDIYGKKHGNKKLAKTKFKNLVKNNTALAEKIIENTKQMNTVLDLCRKEDEEHKGEQYHAKATFSIRRAEYYLDKKDQDFIAYERDWWDHAIKHAENKKSLNDFASFLKNKGLSTSFVDKNQNFSVDTSVSYNPDDFNVDY